MSAAGDAVVAMARSQIGVTENPPYSSNVPYWDWWGSPAAGAWCAVFGSWAAWHSGYPLCAVDGWGGYTYCPNGTSHSYPTGEALPTASLYPGCHVIYSWYGWGFENGVPVINDGSEWTGWVAGDHWGIATSAVDADGWFTAVEGNTSPTDSGSQDNGGGVWEKWRHISDVCAWYQPPSYGDAPGTGTGPGLEPPQPTYNLTEIGMFLLANDQRGIWLCGPGYAYGLNEEEYAQVRGIPGIGTFQCGNNERAFDLIYGACINGQTADTDDIRHVPRVRLIETMGALHLTDGISTSHIHSPEDIQHAINLGWIAGSESQWVPDTLGRSLIQEAGEPGADDE